MFIKLISFVAQQRNFNLSSSKFLTNSNNLGKRGAKISLYLYHHQQGIARTALSYKKTFMKSEVSSNLSRNY